MQSIFQSRSGGFVLKYIHPSMHLINTYRAPTNGEACVKHGDKEIKKQQLGNSVEAEQETDHSPDDAER